MDENEKIKEGVVHTYAEDLAKVIENNTGSMVKKIIHEEELREEEKINLSPKINQQEQNKLFMLMSFLFIVLSFITIYFFFFKEDIRTVPVEKQFVPIIFNDQYNYQEVLDLKKEQIAQVVLNQVNSTKVKPGGIEGIYLTENKFMIGLRRFVSLTKISFSPDNNQYFIKDNFLMGVVSRELPAGSSTRYGFFILLKTSSTNDAFESMHGWEKKMLTDLHGFIGVDISSTTNYLFQKDFEDGIVENKNARMLYDKDGKIVLMYIYVDNNFVVITNAQSAAHEVILRLVSSEKKQ